MEKNPSFFRFPTEKKKIKKIQKKKIRKKNKKIKKKGVAFAKIRGGVGLKIAFSRRFENPLPPKLQSVIFFFYKIIFVPLI
jgi:hypothetical protein